MSRSVYCIVTREQRSQFETRESPSRFETRERGCHTVLLAVVTVGRKTEGSPGVGLKHESVEFGLEHGSVGSQFEIPIRLSKERVQTFFCVKVILHVLLCCFRPILLRTVPGKPTFSTTTADSCKTFTDIFHANIFF